MTTVKEIENAIVNLPRKEFAKFAAWFEEHQSKIWDRQIEDDSRIGRFKPLIDQAKAEHDAGKSRPL